MKKILFLSLALTIGLTAVAQSGYVKLKNPRVNESRTATLVNAKEAVVEAMEFTPQANIMQTTTIKSGANYEETQVMVSQYDLQTNASLGNRMYAWPDGSVAATATRGMESAPSFPDRGAGYNYYDGSNWGDMPSARIEAARSGWPSIAAWADGEVLVSHDGTQINMHTRPAKGTGDWTAYTFPNPDGWNLTWPRVATTGANHDVIHVIAADQDANNTAISETFYTRSTDGGATWSDWATPPLVDNEFYNYNISADDYTMAANGDNIAIMFASAWYDLFFIKSTDGGETWEKTVVWEHPYPTFNWDTSITTDTLYACDNSAAITMDNNGKVHIAFAITRVTHTEAGTTYQFFPFTEGIAYWNEDMGPIPTNPENDHKTLDPEYLDSMGMLVGWVPDIDGDGEINIFDFESPITYRSLSLTTFPSISVDDIGTVVVAYSTLDETRVNEIGHYRSIFTSYKDGVYGTWYPAEDNLTDNFIHLFDECIATTAPNAAYDNTFYVMYGADTQQGLALDDEHAYQDNQYYVVKITPLIVGENEFVNPITEVSSAYPNPVTGNEVNFDLNLSKSVNNVNVSVHNIVGQMVQYQEFGTMSTGMNRISLNTDALQSGIYFYTVTVDNYKETKKVTVK